MVDLNGSCSDLRDMIERSAAEEGLSPLSDAHWAVISFVLEYHRAHQRVPVVVRIGRKTGLGPRQLSALFPAGAAKTVLRMAGIPLPSDPGRATDPFELN